MNPLLLRLVLLVSCAHALVHVYELALPSVEQLIAKEYEVGKETTGFLATTFRLPFGVFAVVVGWLADRWGAKRMLVTYLVGCGLASAAIAASGPLPTLFVSMFALGTFASIYHPAGLALIAHQTSAANRARALGMHGIFGSAGIGAAPFLAGAALSLDGSWRQYYLILMVPGLLLAVVFMRRLSDYSQSAERERREQGHSDVEEHSGRWGAFLLLTLFGVHAGFIYAALLAFLPRYLDGAGLSLGDIPAAGMRNYLTGAVLLVGIIGQFTAGRFARPGKLEWQLAAVMLANAPLLAAMAIAEGIFRPWTAGALALVHFMNQPIYNSLIANYVPRSRRSLAYGFSFLMSFGMGSLGAAFAGAASTNRACYGTLAGVALSAGLLALVMGGLNARHTARMGHSSLL